MWKRIRHWWEELDVRLKVPIIGGLFGLAVVIIPIIIEHCIDDDGEPRIEICLVNEDAPGDDNYNLNGEWIEICNTGDKDMDMSGWKLQDKSRHVYRFPNEFVLKKGKSVTVYTGSGEDTASELYWGSSRSIWTNKGDCAYLVDESGNEVYTYEW